MHYAVWRDSELTSMHAQGQVSSQLMLFSVIFAILIIIHYTMISVQCTQVVYTGVIIITSSLNILHNVIIEISSKNLIIIESVDSISRDGPDMPYM